MKYCKKCGMLLEDNMERCIGCGTDVTGKGSYTKYPEPVQEKLDTEKKEAGKKMLAVFAIILVFVALFLMVGIYLSQMYMAGGQGDDESGPATGMFTQMLKDSIDNDNNDGGVNTKNREVKDENGTYYKLETVDAQTGHDMFYTVFPEDFTETECTIDFSRDSQLFPAVLTFVQANEDNTAQLTFISPQHYQYISGTGFSQEDMLAATGNCISFYDFKTVEDYLKDILKQRYPNAKKIEALDENDGQSEVPAKLNDIIKLYDDNIEKELAGLFGLPNDTKFSHKDTYKSDRILNYRILTKDDHAVNCRFFVPVFCETFDFENEELEMSGTISDCYILTEASFEAGSDELYDQYEDAFGLFVDNLRLTDDFYMLQTAYADDIKKAIRDNDTPKIIDEKKADELLSNNKNISGFNGKIKDFLNDHYEDDKEYENGEYRISAHDPIVQVYLDPEKKLIFVTGDESEYPGDQFLELKAGGQ